MRALMSIVVLAVTLTATQAQAWDCPAPFSGIADKAKRCSAATAAKKNGALTGAQKSACCADKPSGGTRRRTTTLTGNYVKVDDFNAFTGEEGDFGKLQAEVKRLATFHPGGTDSVTHDQLFGIIIKMFFLLLGMVIVAGVMGFIAWRLRKMIKDNTEADARRDEELAWRLGKMIKDNTEADAHRNEELAKLAAAVIAKTDVEVSDLA